MTNLDCFKIFGKTNHYINKLNRGNLDCLADSTIINQAFSITFAIALYLHFCVSLIHPKAFYSTKILMLKAFYKYPKLLRYTFLLSLALSKRNILAAMEKISLVFI